jgi:GT2 family glycosyltransferase
LTRIAVVIATYNRLAKLRRCLDSIAAQTSVEHQVIVVDNGSTDGTREHLGQRRDVQAVLLDRLTPLPQVYNPVWRDLRCDYTCWLSDDIELVAPAFDVGVAALDERPEVGMVGLKMRDVGEHAKPYSGALSRYGILNCNHGVVRVGLLNAVGGFHDGYRVYMVDPDLTAAVLSTGATVVMTRKVVLLHDRGQPVDRAGRESVERDRADPAKELYARRYRYLDRPRPTKDRILRGLARTVLRGLLAKLPQNGSRLGLNRRDQYVLGSARFLSPLDPLRSAGRTVHLVQRIPPALLLDEANPYRGLAASRLASRRATLPAR